MYFISQPAPLQQLPQQATQSPPQQPARPQTIWFLKLFWESWELQKKVCELVIKKTFTINEKNKDLGLLKKVWKQEKLRGDFWFWKLFWKSWELFSARQEHSISVPDSTSLNHCLQTSYIGTTLQPLGYGPPRCRHLPQPGNL